MFFFLYYSNHVFSPLFSELGTGHFRKDKMGSFGSNSHGLYRSHFTPTRNSTDDFRNPIGRIKIKVKNTKTQIAFSFLSFDRKTILWTICFPFFKVQILKEGHKISKKISHLFLKLHSTGKKI